MGRGWEGDGKVMGREWEGDFGGQGPTIIYTIWQSHM